MSKLTKTEIPTLSPEFAQRGRKERGAHDGSRVDSNLLPGESYYLKTAEVKEQDQAQHPDPALDERVRARKSSGYHPKQRRANGGGCDGPKPVTSSRRRNSLAGIEKR